MLLDNCFLFTYFILLFHTVSSHSEVEVTWYLGDEEIKPSDKYEMEYHFGVHRIFVHGVEQEDAGKWRCIATNRYGATTSECQVTVVGMYSVGHHLCEHAGLICVYYNIFL